MNDIGIFVIGIFVTLLVATALALPLIGAVMDGRRQAREASRARAAEEARPQGAVPSPPG